MIIVLWVVEAVNHAHAARPRSYREGRAGARFPESLFPIPKYSALLYREISMDVILTDAVKLETRSFLASCLRRYK